MAKRKPAKRKARRLLSPDRPCGNMIDGTTLVQSLHFDKKKHPRGKKRWDPKSATAWAREHGYVAPQVDETPNQLRVRQFDPGFCEYRSVPYGKSGITAVIETPERRPPPAHVVREVNAKLVEKNLRCKAS